MKKSTPTPEFFDSFETQLNHEVSEIQEALREIRIEALSMHNNRFMSPARFRDIKRRIAKTKSEGEQLIKIPIVAFAHQYNYFRPVAGSLSVLSNNNKN